MAANALNAANEHGIVGRDVTGGGAERYSVSVIIRSMGRPSLEAAMRSVFGQTCQGVEIVLVNASGGEHRALAEDCAAVKVRIVNQGGERLPRAIAANVGLDAAQGEWLLFLDDDDAIDPEHLARLLSAAERHQSMVVYAGVRVVDSSGQELYALDEDWDRVRMWQGNFLPIHAVLVRRSFVEAAEARFDEALDVYEDWDFWLQLAMRAPFLHVPGISATYFLAGNSGLAVDADPEYVRQARARIYAKWRARVPPDELAVALARAEVARSLQAKLQADLQAQRALTDEVSRERDELRSTKSRLEGARAALRASIKGLAGEYQELREELQRSVHAYLRLDTELRALETAYRDLAADHAATLQSTSWRITAPLRSAVGACRPAALRRSFFRVCRAGYHALPVTSTQRIKLRHLVLRSPLGDALQKSWGGGVVESAAPAPLVAVDKERVRTESLAELAAFLETGQRLRLPEAGVPKVTILLVLFNQAGLTFQCLKALAQDFSVPFETIIVDNASSDESGQLLDCIDGARIVRNADNKGFLLACNQGAQLAKGEYLLFLNNDAVVLPETLTAAVSRLDGTPDAGAVGGKILLWEGLLQEAGSIVWQDGGCLGYGRGEDPNDSIYSHVRDVDYCSGAFLLTRTELFRSMGGFDIDYAPAYYEESDYCVRLWEAGWRIVYDPAVRIRHFEFASAGPSSAWAIDLQTKHRAVFVGKHQLFLSERLLPSMQNVLQARQRLSKTTPRVLFIDDRLPRRDLGGGFPRALEFVHSLVECGAFVTHYPLQFPYEPWELGRRVLPETVEIVAGKGASGLESFFDRRHDFYDFVIVSRPHNMIAVDAVVGRHPKWFERLPIIYDAEAMFSLRQIVQAEVLGNPVPKARQEQMIADELAITRHADAIVTVSEPEARHFRDYGKGNVFVLGHSLDVEASVAGFEERAGYLFVGALLADETPNADSLVWFLREVWPRILAFGPAHLDIVGHCEAPSVRAFASDFVHIHGGVDSVDPFYARARVFIVPTRFAAGIPHKAHEAAAHGLPMVTTPLIAGQLGWQEELGIADQPADFAEACLRLCNQAELWSAKRDAALRAVRRDCSSGAFRQVVATILRSRLR